MMIISKVVCLLLLTASIGVVHSEDLPLLRKMIVARKAASINNNNNGSPSEFAGYSLLAGNCPGSEIDQFGVHSRDECASKCTMLDECRGFTISNDRMTDSQYLCLLKSAACDSPMTSEDFTYHKKQATGGTFLIGGGGAPITAPVYNYGANFPSGSPWTPWGTGQQVPNIPLPNFPSVPSVPSLPSGPSLPTGGSWSYIGSPWSPSQQPGGSWSYWGTYNPIPPPATGQPSWSTSWSSQPWSSQQPSWTTSFPWTQTWSTQPSTWTTSGPWSQPWTTQPSWTPQSWSTWTPQSWTTSWSPVWATWSPSSWTPAPTQWTPWYPATSAWSNWVPPATSAWTGPSPTNFPGFTNTNGHCYGNNLYTAQYTTPQQCADECARNSACYGFSIDVHELTAPFDCVFKNTDCTSPQPDTRWRFYRKTSWMPPCSQRHTPSPYTTSLPPRTPCSGSSSWSNAFGSSWTNNRVLLPSSNSYQTTQYPAATAWSGGFLSVPPVLSLSPSLSLSSSSSSSGGNAASKFTRLRGNCGGHFIGGIQSLSLEQCAQECLDTKGCNGFSHVQQTSYPQCILKSSGCSNPDPTGVFSFYQRNGAAVAVAAKAADSDNTNWWTAGVRPFKKSRNRYYELPFHCSGPILKGPENWDLDTCADKCLADTRCSGFSYDITMKSEPHACILRSGVCQAMAISSRWAYFERADSKAQKQLPSVMPVTEPDFTSSQAAMSTDFISTSSSLSSSSSSKATTAIVDESSILSAREAETQPIPTSQSVTVSIDNDYSDRPSYNIENIELTSRFEQMNGNCPGNVLADEEDLSLAECARECLKTTQCAGFTFNVQRQTRPYQCVLKSKGCTDPAGLNGQWRFFSRRNNNNNQQPGFFMPESLQS